MEHSTWHKLLKEELPDHYFSKINQFMDQVYSQGMVYPPREKVFNALLETPFEEVRVVILGQDPYHGPHQAQGLSFSVPDSLPAPPSLKNILKELEEDLGPRPFHDLTSWAEQGVLLLNSVLTVEKDKPASHQNKGWEIFTDRIIEELNKSQTPIVFLLWGNFAKQKARLITNKKHLILTSSHPSPFSVKYGFEGCSHFSKANKFLASNNLTPIDWQIDDI